MQQHSKPLLTPGMTQQLARACMVGALWGQISQPLCCADTHAGGSSAPGVSWHEQAFRNPETIACGWKIQAALLVSGMASHYT